MNATTARAATPDENPRFALTIHQPYAQLVVTGQKAIENRSWSTTYRGWLLVHAARFAHKDLPTKAIIGAARLVAIHDQPTGLPGEDTNFRYHWELADPIEFPTPISVSGKQGLWRIPQPLFPVVAKAWAEITSAHSPPRPPSRGSA